MDLFRYGRTLSFTLGQSVRERPKILKIGGQLIFICAFRESQMVGFLVNLHLSLFHNLIKQTYVNRTCLDVNLIFDSKISLVHISLVHRLYGFYITVRIFPRFTNPT